MNRNPFIITKRGWQSLPWGFAIALLGMGTTWPVQATSNSTDPIRVGVWPSPPKVFWNAEGEPAGFFPEILQDIANREEWTLDYVACEWPVCLEMLEDGDLDLLLDVSYSQKRDTRFDFNREVFFSSWSVVFARPGVAMESILDLQGKRIAVLESGIQYEALQETAKEFGIQPIFVQVSDYNQSFQLLATGQVDGVVVNRFFPTHQHLQNAVNTNILIKPAQVHIAAPEGQNGDLLSTIDQYLAGMKNDPNSLYYQAGERWLEGIDIYKTDWVFIRQLGGGLILVFVGGITILMILWNRSLRSEIAERIKVQKKLHHQALYDGLTDLPNRCFLLSHLEAQLQQCQGKPYLCWALMFLDLDRFKLVNDSLGHLAGDQLLREMAGRLKHMGYLVCRLGGDEFVIFQPIVDQFQEVLETAEKILSSLQTPYVLANQEIVISGSIGIVLGPASYQNPIELLRDADIAMYYAKGQGRNCFALFTKEMRDSIAQRLALENDLRRAIYAREFELYYQPILDLKTGQLDGFEALIRWQHPTQGLLSPITFITLAEETGLIIPLGWWILETALKQLKQWQIDFPNHNSLSINVNVSAVQLQKPDFLQRLDAILDHTGMAGHCLILEITESLLIDDLTHISELLHQLKLRSIGISIDDFGTGYSSFCSLHHLPITSLKIDRFFIRDILETYRDRSIVQTLLVLAQSLGVKTTAEGIETQDQMMLLQSLGCELGQGYLFDKPLPAAVAEKRLQQAAMQSV
jgi:diguanylate cyclase (GGDEF)-like protein